MYFIIWIIFNNIQLLYNLEYLLQRWLGIGCSVLWKKQKNNFPSHAVPPKMHFLLQQCWFPEREHLQEPSAGSAQNIHFSWQHFKSGKSQLFHYHMHALFLYHNYWILTLLRTKVLIDATILKHLVNSE